MVRLLYSFTVPQNIKHNVIIGPSTSTLYLYTHKKGKHTEICTRMLVILVIIHKKGKHFSINWWIDMENAQNPWSGTLFILEKESYSGTCSHIGDSEKHIFMWKTPDMKSHMLHDSFYMKYP